MNLMGKLLITIGLAALCINSVQAGNESEQTNAVTGQYKKQEENDILNHLERGETPRENFKPIQLKANKTIHYTIKLGDKAKPVKKCQAALSIGYLQFDTKARVDTTITNDDCAASSGQYEVLLQIRDASGETHMIQHVESWSRNNDAQVETKKFYNIGSNVELVHTAIQGLTCTCVQETANGSK